MTRRRAVIIAMSLATAVAAWELGHGLWIHVKARLAQALLHRAWERIVAGETRVKPWPWADTWPVARLRVPAHNIDLIVLDGMSGRTLAFAPGAASVSAQRGVAFVTGHRDTHFRFLEHVRTGDVILVEAPNRAGGRYIVREITIVDARYAVIRNDPDSHHLVLLTCYPFDAITPGGPLRYIVAADRTTS
jgi:sortase A